MAVGTVTFHKERMLKRTLVRERENAIVNRINKTRKEVRFVTIFFCGDMAHCGAV